MRSGDKRSGAPPASGAIARRSDTHASLALGVIWFRRCRERSRMRRQYAALLAVMGERGLNDMGVRRSDIEYELNKPFWEA